MHKALERPHSCDCGERYKTRGGLSRHRRQEHNIPFSCFRCDFKWTRPVIYRAHLRACHHDVDCDKVLGKPEGSRRRSIIIGRDPPQLFPPPAIEPNRQSQAEPRQRPMTSPLPAVAKVTHVPSPPVAYDPQPEYAGPAITMRKYEEARGLGYFGATDAPSAFPSIEEWA
jgi:hypothetical protein